MSLDTEAGTASITMLCVVFGVSRAAYYKAKARAARTSQEEAPTLPSPAQPRCAPPRCSVSTETLREAIRAIVEAHPAWGVRKVHATLRRAPYELRVGKNRVWALMKDMGLCFAPGTSRVRATHGHVVVPEPNRRWATDMTTTFTTSEGNVAVTIVVDCGCRSVLAVQATKSQESQAILAPVRDALRLEFGTAGGVPDGLELRTDHGPQYTGSDCHALCIEWQLDHTFAPVGRPTGNAVAERVIRTMKEECIWLADWSTLEELQAALDAWRTSYNEERPHQALEWQTPAEVRASRQRLLMAA